MCGDSIFLFLQNRPFGKLAHPPSRHIAENIILGPIPSAPPQKVSIIFWKNQLLRSNNAREKWIRPRVTQQVPIVDAPVSFFLTEARAHQTKLDPLMLKHIREYLRA